MKDMKKEMKKDKKEAPEQDMHKDAKLTALKDLRSMASEMMGEGLKKTMVEPKMKSQVTVAADNPEDLKKGLDKAKEVVPDLDKYMDEHNEEMDSIPAEQDEMEDEEASEEDRIAELEAELAALKSKVRK